MQAAQKYAVVVGIAKYQDHGTPWLQFADRDADLFSSYLAKLGIAASNVAVIKDDFASSAAIRESIRHVLVDEASAGDDVYVFLSARGIATSYYRGGFVLGYMSRLDHPISTAVSTDDLKQLVQQTKANIYLFADLDRDPPGPQVENTIQQAIKSVWQIHPQMAALLGSIPGQHSLENKALEGGHGVFGYYLVKALGEQAVGGRGGEVNLETLFRQLRQELEKGTTRKQSPYELAPQARPGAPQKTSYWRGQQPLLIPASYRIPSSETNDSPDGAAMSATDLYGWARQHSPEAVIARYRAATNDVQQKMAWQYEVALEDIGEEIFARSGDSDECLKENDPYSLKRNDYARAERSFELAATLAPDERLRRVLQAKQQFARGRVLIIDKKYADAELVLTAAIEAFAEMPELHNALGTAYFEQGRYSDAIRAFEEAVQLAPDWSYARQNLALAYIRNGNYSAAQTTYTQAIARAPSEPSLNVGLGSLLTQLHRPEDADQQYAQALQMERAQENEARKRQATWTARAAHDPLASHEAALENSEHNKFLCQAGETLNGFCVEQAAEGKSTAVGAVIGIAMGPQFRYSGTIVAGNANLMPGKDVTSLDQTVTINLKDGCDFLLSPNSTVTVDPHKVILESGRLRARQMGNCKMAAGPWTITGNNVNSDGVLVYGNDRMQVCSLSGTFVVTGASCTLAAAVTPGAYFDVGGTEQSGAYAGSPGRAWPLLPLLLGPSLGALGLATDAILQPVTPTSP